MQGPCTAGTGLCSLFAIILLPLAKQQLANFSPWLEEAHPQGPWLRLSGWCWAVCSGWTLCRVKSCRRGAGPFPVRERGGREGSPPLSCAYRMLPFLPASKSRSAGLSCGAQVSLCRALSSRVSCSAVAASACLCLCACSVCPYPQLFICKGYSSANDGSKGEASPVPPA